MDSHTTTAATATPATALFSLQVAVDELSFQPPVTTSSSSSFVLAFQLLQFDIVVFETATLVRQGEVVTLGSHVDTTASDGTEPSPPAQSCLFECDALRLARDIQDDCDAALVLLALQREDQRARLAAFACVRLDLPHLAFAGDGRAPRVSEWASVEATWPLVDHQRVTRGSLRGAVTLACLGRALAPHLAVQRDGSSMMLLATSPASRSRTEPIAVASEGQLREAPLSGKELSESSSSPVARNETPKSEEPLKLQDLSAFMPKQEELRDAAVQCEEDPNDRDDMDRARHSNGYPKPILIRGGPNPSRASDSPRLRCVDELDRLRIDTVASPMRRRDKKPQSQRDRIRYDGPSAQRFPRSKMQQEPFLEAELPPPLFFHKPKQHRQPGRP